MPDAHAGNYVGTYFAQVPVSPATNPITFQASTTPSQYSGGTCYRLLGYTGTNPNDMTKRIFKTAPDTSASDGSYQGSSAGDGINGTQSNCSGAIQTAWKWVPAKDQTMTTDPPPTQVIIMQTCSVSVGTGMVGSSWSYSTGLGKSGSGTFNPQVNPATSGGSGADTKYFVMAGGASVTLPALSASATVSTGNSSASLSYTANIYPVLVTPTGCNPAYQALTGQQITATLSGVLMAWVHSYTWSFMGGTKPNPIKNWSGLVYHDQLTALSEADLTGTDTSGYGITVNPISFYDEVADSLTIKCAVSLTFPDGTTGSVSPQSKLVTFFKPTVSWTVAQSLKLTTKTVTQGFHTDANDLYANELWGPISITEPPALIPNGSGYGCMAQIASLGRTFTRIPLNDAPAVFSHILVGFGSNTNGMVANPTGLDVAFPYPAGYIVNANGTLSPDTYSPFEASTLGYSSDGPTQPFTISASDNGGNNWQSSTADDGFITYVMYQPPAYNGYATIWIPLQLLYWSWGGDANLVNNSWLVTNPMFSPGTPVNTTTPPVWTLEILGSPALTFGP